MDKMDLQQIVAIVVAIVALAYSFLEVLVKGRIIIKPLINYRNSYWRNIKITIDTGYEKTLSAQKYFNVRIENMGDTPVELRSYQILNDRNERIFEGKHSCTLPKKGSGSGLFEIWGIVRPFSKTTDRDPSKKARESILREMDRRRVDKIKVKFKITYRAPGLRKLNKTKNKSKKIWFVRSAESD